MKQRMKVIRKSVRNAKMALLNLHQPVCHSPIICILIVCLPQIDSVDYLSLDNRSWSEPNLACSYREAPAIIQMRHESFAIRLSFVVGWQTGVSVTCIFE